MFYPLSSGSAVKICAFASKQDLRVTQVSVLKLLPVTALCFKGHLCFTTPRSETSSPSHRPPHNLLSDSSLSLHPETQDSPSTPCFELLFDNCHAEGIVGMASILDQTHVSWRVSRFMFSPSSNQHSTCAGYCRGFPPSYFSKRHH